MSVDVTGGIPWSLQGPITDGAEEERRGGKKRKGVWNRYSNTDQVPKGVFVHRKGAKKLIST